MVRKNAARNSQKITTICTYLLTMDKWKSTLSYKEINVQFQVLISLGVDNFNSCPAGLPGSGFFSLALCYIC